jgi:hypothetical protein
MDGGRCECCYYSRNQIVLVQLFWALFGLMNWYLARVKTERLIVWDFIIKLPKILEIWGHRVWHPRVSRATIKNGWGRCEWGYWSRDQIVLVQLSLWVSGRLFNLMWLLQEKWFVLTFAAAFDKQVTDQVITDESCTALCYHASPYGQRKWPYRDIMQHR